MAHEGRSVEVTEHFRGIEYGFYHFEVDDLHKHILKRFFRNSLRENELVGVLSHVRCQRGESWTRLDLEDETDLNYTVHHHESRPLR